MSDWPAAERRAFIDMAPLVATVSTLVDLSASERQSVIEMMRAKGRPQERDFALASARCERLFRSFAALPSA